MFVAQAKLRVPASRGVIWKLAAQLKYAADA